MEKRLTKKTVTALIFWMSQDGAAFEGEMGCQNGRIAAVVNA